MVNAMTHNNRSSQEHVPLKVQQRNDKHKFMSWPQCEQRS